MLTLDTIKTELRPIAQRCGVKRMYLFGSYANGTAGPESDVDILIEKGEPLSHRPLRHEAEYRGRAEPPDRPRDDDFV